MLDLQASTSRITRRNCESKRQSGVWGSWISVSLNLVLGIGVLWLLRREVRRWWRRIQQEWKDHKPRRWKPKSPEDCMLCCTGIQLKPIVQQSVPPYAEVKSPRGRKKRIETTGYACPTPNCTYCGITDEVIHALVGYGIQSGSQRFKCQSCGKVSSNRTLNRSSA